MSIALLLIVICYKTLQGEAVEMIAKGNAPRIVQPVEGASYDPYITTKPELAEVYLF
jgi:hypothetical protein